MGNENETTAVSVEVMPDQNSLAVIERANIDIQITTAHAYPRSMALFKKRATEMITQDEETAQSCIFRRPVGKKYNPQTRRDEIEYAEGMSVRMAEIGGACYGNIRVAAQIVEMTPRFVRARGFAHDLESNYASASEVVESTVKSNGEPFSERMRVVVSKSALAKSRRDAFFQVVPRALFKSLEDLARQTAIGDNATLDKRRTLLMDWINKRGIEPARVWSALNIKGIEDVGLDQLETLIGLKTALKENSITVDEAFPPPEGRGDTAGEKSDVADRLRAASKGNPDPEATASAQPTAPGKETAKPDPVMDAIKALESVNVPADLAEGYLRQAGKIGMTVKFKAAPKPVLLGIAADPVAFGKLVSVWADGKASKAQSTEIE